MTAHAFAGDGDSARLDRILGRDNAHRAYFGEWCTRRSTGVGTSIGLTPGTIHHLWHGEMADRRYVLRNRELADLNFDPARDLALGPTGFWAWSTTGGRIREWAREYFEQRREDHPFPAC